jgi:hypothetical protein
MRTVQHFDLKDSHGFCMVLFTDCTLLTFVDITIVILSSLCALKKTGKSNEE